MIKDWHELADSYDQSLTNSRAMTRIVGPGNDMASKAFAKTANSSGRSYMDYLQHNRDFCVQQAASFQAALNTYLGVEQANADEINKAGQDASRPEV